MNTALPPTQRSNPHAHRRKDRDLVTHAILRPTILIALFGLAACSEETPTGPSAPTAVIASPASGLTLYEGVPIRLAGGATDPQDGPLTAAALAWSSSIDGPLGTGGALDVTLPSTGVHTITLTATDSDGNKGDAAVSLLIEELEFLDGTVAEPQIGIVVHSLASAVRLFQVGNPEERHDIALGASSAVTATGISIRGETAVVPLGNAASVATIELRSRQIASFFLFESGNATGSAFVDDRNVLVANQETDEVGRFTLGQGGGSITDLVSVTQFPTSIVPVSDSLAFVISANLDDTYAPAGDGVVTALNPRTMTVTAEIGTGGTNPQLGALGPDGLLYVMNTGDYVAPSTLAIIDPATLERVGLAHGFPPGSGHVHVSGDGTLFASAFFTGTVAWNTDTGTFVRDASHPICAPLDGGGCRGAFAAHSAADGSLYQTFFGSVRQGLPPQIFRYEPGTFTLADSIASEGGPVAVEIRSFRR